MAQRVFIIPAGAFGAGVLSALLSAAIHYGLVTGILIVPLLPIIPIMMTGFAYGVIGLSTAALTALVLTPLMIGFDAGMLTLALSISRPGCLPANC